MKEIKDLFNQEAIKKIAQEKKKWMDKAAFFDKEDQNRFKTLSGLTVNPLYTPEDVSGMDYVRDLGYPGDAPFVRGVYPTMYRGRTWTLRQLAGYGPAEETNLRYKFLLDQGATGINGVFDYPTLRGFDSTDPMARADVGLGGVAIDTLDDMRILFDGIPIDRVSASLVTCNPLCNISLQSMYFANARMRDIPFTNLAGTSQNDFLMETAITVAAEVLPPEFSFKLCCDAIEFCARHVPRWNPVSYTGYNYREAGCTAVQEAAFVMANAIACIEELVGRGLNVDDFAPRLSFFFSAHNDFFEEIAKYRSARRLWARIMEKRFGAKNPKSLAFRFHVQTAGVALTAQQPLNNVSRSAYHGLAAALGGAQSIHIDAYDEALCIPTELASLTALRTSQILQLETRVTHTIDPLGGSYFVESLTNRLEEEIEGLLDEIDRLGGIVKATEIGWVHNEISNSAYQYQQDIETGAMPIVGVNCFRMEDEELPVDIFQVPETLEIQTAKLKKIKAERSAAEVQKALDAITRCCDARENLMEVIVDVVDSRVTEGEISQAIKKVYGTWEIPLF
ncbi:MAG: methylmalonyl-CoA mutase [Deltaproteobacteria bacterium]|nr:methylmalonyl-CoA mutase [Deltaproteobacteria bacterium]